MKSFGQVILNIAHEKIDRPFTYKIPDFLKDEIKEGSCVIIPFGLGNKEKQGYVIKITDTCNYDESKVKSIIGLATNQIGLEDRMIQLAFWIKQTYGSTLIQALKTVLPMKKESTHKMKKQVEKIATDSKIQEIYELCIKKNMAARKRAIEPFLEKASYEYDELKKEYDISLVSLKWLEERGIIKITTKREFRNSYEYAECQQVEKVLSDEQEAIVTTVKNDMQQGKNKSYYIHGITGSGKTQVYIEIMKEVIKDRKQVIVLIPEIALTYQTLHRFYECFGDRVSVLNSTLSQGEKYDQCERAKKGEIDIVIGPRSALFTPFLNLGLIVIDEEHESSYKNEYSPRYHAREVAEKIAQMEGASLILGSATPSIEAYYKAKQGKYHLFEMKKRMGGGTLPKVDIVDMREELKEGNRSILCRKLEEGIREKIAKGEQIILFLNRRGYAGFISCRACGSIMKCPHCDVSLTEHRDGNLHCHYCGYMQKKVTTCPSCGSKYLKGFRAGTEQIEEILKSMFEHVRILRMDADTTRHKGDYEKILKAFENKEADILLGTQMIVKGHDFKDVTLVGVLAADLSLGVPDYRSGERTFQLLTQAAGRAGRGEKAGMVYIQTYQPEHYSVVHASNHDYLSFYEEELVYRSLSKYPPIMSMLAVQVSSKKLEKANEKALFLAKQCKDSGQKIQVLEPKISTSEKFQDIYRITFYVKAREYYILIQIKDMLDDIIYKIEENNVSVQFDFNPNV